jgi:hypothetical protein
MAVIVSGRGSRSVLGRYNIAERKEMKEAAAKQEGCLRAVMGTISGTHRQNAAS